VRSRMMTLLDQAVERATANQAALTAKGFTAAKTTALQTLLTNLRNTDKEQGALKLESITKTGLYYTAMNAVWTIMKEINTAAQIAFAGNYEKLNQYELYPESSTSELEFTILLTQPGDNIKSRHIISPLTLDQPFEFQMLEGNGNCNICMTTVSMGTCVAANPRTLHPNESITWDYAILGGAGQHLKFAYSGTNPCRIRVRVPGL
jgi:hypothetical protein